MPCRYIGTPMTGQLTNLKPTTCIGCSLCPLFLCGSLWPNRQWAGGNKQKGIAKDCLNGD